MSTWELVQKNNYDQMTIYWSRHRPLDSFLRRPNDEDSYFYALLIKSSRGSARLAFLGMVWDQNVNDRLRYHPIIQTIKQERPLSNILVSTGDLKQRKSRYILEQVVEAAGKLLIYSHDTLYNTRETAWINPERHLFIENRGSLRGHLARRVVFGPIYL